MSSQRRRAWVGRIVAVTALGAAITTVVAGCSSTGGPTAGDSSTPVSGGTLTLGVGMAITNFDPYEGSSQNNILDKTVYQNLVQYDANLNPEPDAATAWTFNSDSTSVTITLRDEKFSDGTPLTANDVVTGVTRALDPKAGLSQVGTAAFIKSATAVDDHTVEVDFTSPTSKDRVFDWMFIFPVVEGSKNDPTALQTTTAGSGPFMLDSYNPGTDLTLVRNPNYFDAGKPYLDKVVYRFFSDQDGMVAALQSGDIQGALWEDVKYDQQVQGAGFQLYGGTGEVETLYLNPTMAPFDDLACRQAVLRAVDRDKIRTISQGDNGDVVPLPFPANSPANDPSLLDQIGYDADAAKAGIAANCSTTTATADVQPGSDASNLFTVLQADLKDVGFDLQLKNIDTANFLSDLRAGKVQVDAFPTLNPFRSPVSLATNRGLSADDALNYEWFGVGVPADYKAAVAQAASAVSDSDIAAATKAFNKALVDNAWATGVYTKVERFTMSPKVQGFAFTPANQFVLTDAFVTQ